MPLTLDQEEILDTCKIMLAGFVFAILLTLPMLNWIYGYDWSWVDGFPFGWMGLSLTYMTTLFHEMGHTVMFWFYGYVTLPSFDLQHGGGMSYTITGQLIILHLALYILLGYGFVQLQGHRNWQMACIAIGIFHLATAHFDFHQALCIFAGPLAQVIVGSFFLVRAWLNAAPSPFERFLSAAFGFGMLLMVIFDGWALVHNDVWRLVYFEQKGAHAAGDFDRIAELMDIGFTKIIWVWMSCALAGLIMPLAFYLYRIRTEAESL